MIYDLTQTTFSELNTGDVLNVPYSGDKISVTLPAGVYTLETWGAQGGYRSSSTYGGKGGYSKGTITLQDPTNVHIYAGGSGNSKTASGNSSVLTEGGFNGGGSRYRYCGGGGSDGATSKTGMYGGGTSGGTATQSYGSGGGGGTQTAGGAGGSNNAGTFGHKARR